MEEFKNIFILAKDGAKVEAIAAKMVKSRPVEIHFYTDLREFLAALMAGAPDFIAISMDFDHPKIENLPRVISAVSQRPVIACTETGDTAAFKSVNRSRSDIKIPSRLNAHNLWMKIVSFEATKEEKKREAQKKKKGRVSEKVSVKGLSGQFDKDKGKSKRIRQAHVDDIIKSLDDPEHDDDDANGELSDPSLQDRVKVGSRKKEDLTDADGTNDSQRAEGSSKEITSQKDKDKGTVGVTGKTGKGSDINKAKGSPLQGNGTQGKAQDESDRLSSSKATGSYSAAEKGGHKRSNTRSGENSGNETGNKENENPRIKTAKGKKPSQEEQKNGSSRKAKASAPGDEEGNSRPKIKSLDNKSEDKNGRQSVNSGIAGGANPEKKGETQGLNKAKSKQKEEENELDLRLKKKKSEGLTDSADKSKRQKGALQNQANKNRKQGVGQSQKGRETNKRNGSSEKSGKKSRLNTAGNKKNRSQNTDDEKAFSKHMTLLEQACEAALARVFGGQRVEETREYQSTNLSVIVVNHSDFKGYLLMTNSFDLEEEKLKDFRSCLTKEALDLGLDGGIEQELHIKVQPVGLHSWSEEKCEFSIFSHEGNGREKCLTFLQRKKVLPPYKLSEDKKRVLVDLQHIPPGTLVNFDAFIYLPKNDRYVKVLKKGCSLGLDQIKRFMKSDKYKEFHIPVEEKIQFYEFYIHNRIVWEFLVHEKENSVEEAA